MICFTSGLYPNIPCWSSTTAMPFNGIKLNYFCSAVRFLNRPAIRNVSRFSAIRKGFSAERGLAEPRPKATPRSRTRQDAKSSKTGWSPAGTQRPIPKTKDDDLWSVSPMGVSSDSIRRADRFSHRSLGLPKDTKTSKAKGEQSIEHAKPKMSSERRGKQEEKKGPAAPESLPFTTAASEFLFGYSAVLAALKANRRKLYKLYLHPRANKESGSTKTVEQLCRQSGVTVVHVDNKWLRAMDKVADGRPHNVCCSQHPNFSCQPQ